MAKIKVEVEVPDGDKCIGDSWFCKYEHCDYCSFFREHKSSPRKLPQCFDATVEEKTMTETDECREAFEEWVESNFKNGNESNKLVLYVSWQAAWHRRAPSGWRPILSDLAAKMEEYGKTIKP